VGVALFLSHLATSGKKCSELRKTYPDYFICKKKIELTPEIDIDAVLLSVKDFFRNEKLTTIDGLKVDFEKSWVHLRKSNTEPIIRIYAEAKSPDEAGELADRVIAIIRENAGA
jgi:phosphomannomutase